MPKCRCSGRKCRLSAEDERHGTYNAYQNHGCRCDPCRAGHAIYLRGRKRARISRGIPERVHGTVGGYGNWGCRCRACSLAWSADASDRYQRRLRGDTACARGECAPPKRRDYVYGVDK